MNHKAEPGEQVPLKELMTDENIRRMLIMRLASACFAAVDLLAL
jgi:hypothetical protein